MHDNLRLTARAVILALASLCTLARSASSLAQEPRQPESFENLFRSLEQQSRPPVKPPVTVQFEELESQINRLIDTRRETVGADGSLFKVINDTMQQDAVCRAAVSQLYQAMAQLRSCQSRFSAEQATSARLGKDTLALRGARIDFENSQASVQAAQANVQTQMTRLNELYVRLRRDIPPFFNLFDKFRQLLPLEQGPVTAQIAANLDRAAANCPHFIEGRIVTAVALVYAGRDKEAAESLEKADAIFGECPALIQTMLAEDRCAAWLLLGRPDKIAKFVVLINGVHARHRSATQDWLLGANASALRRREDASRHFTAAVKKAGKAATPAMIAEAVLASAWTTPTDRRPVKAIEFLERVEESEAWQVLQGRAAVSAAEGQWQQAIDFVAACRKKAPPCLTPELDRQRSAYEREEIWRR